MVPIDKLFLQIFICLIVFGGSTCSFAARDTSVCLTPSELRRLDTEFWAHYPSVEEFSHYAATDMKITSNVADVAGINATNSTGRDRAEQFASFLADHPEFFSSLKTAHPPTFLYYVGPDHHPDRLKTTDRYPSGQCVSMFHYDLARVSCVAGQRIRALRLSFVKEDGKVELRGIQLAMEACD